MGTCCSKHRKGGNYYKKKNVIGHNIEHTMGASLSAAVPLSVDRARHDLAVYCGSLLLVFGAGFGDVSPYVCTYVFSPV